MSEKWYDEEIAPRLAAIGKECEEKGLPFVAAVEYAPGATATTATIPESASIGMCALSLLAQANGNIDLFMIHLTRYCRLKGINTDASMVLSDFGKIRHSQ